MNDEPDLRQAGRPFRLRRGLISASTVIALGLGVTILLAARGRTVVRLTAGSMDTVIVNTIGLIDVPVRGVDARGAERRLEGVQYRLTSGTVARVSPTGVAQCFSRGEAVVHATYERVGGDFVLRCRPVRGLRILGTARLRVGGPPLELPFLAVGTDDSLVAELAGTVTIRDSHIVGLENMRLVPRAPGLTAVDIDLGHCIGSFDVDVYTPVSSLEHLHALEQFVGPVSLVRGELRSWRVPPGEYLISVIQDSLAPDALVFGGNRMNCAPTSFIAEQHCVALKNSSIAVRNLEQTTSGVARHGSLVISRWDNSDVVTRTKRVRTDSRPECPVL